MWGTRSAGLFTWRIVLTGLPCRRQRTAETAAAEPRSVGRQSLPRPSSCVPAAARQRKQYSYRRKPRCTRRGSMKLAVDLIGWTGALLILGAYALLSAGRLKARSLAYHLMNILGAFGFVVNSGWKGALPSAALNVIWIGIGTYALFQRRRRHGRLSCHGGRQ